MDKIENQLFLICEGTVYQELIPRLTSLYTVNETTQIPFIKIKSILFNTLVALELSLKRNEN